MLPGGDIVCDAAHRGKGNPRGEDALLQSRLALKDLVSLAEVGVPLTISGGDGYAVDELLAIAEAAGRGGGTLTVRRADAYDPATMRCVQDRATGRVVLA